MFDSREQTVEALTVLHTVNPMTATRKTSLGTKRTSFGTLKRLTLGTRVFRTSQDSHLHGKLAENLPLHHNIHYITHMHGFFLVSRAKTYSTERSLSMHHSKIVFKVW